MGAGLQSFKRSRETFKKCGLNLVSLEPGCRGRERSTLSIQGANARKMLAQCVREMFNLGPGTNSKSQKVPTIFWVVCKMMFPVFVASGALCSGGVHSGAKSLRRFMRRPLSGRGLRRDHAGIDG